MRWSKTIELYPLAMHTSALGVLRSMISVDATLFGRKVASLSNHTPAQNNTQSSFKNIFLAVVFLNRHAQKECPD